MSEPSNLYISEKLSLNFASKIPKLNKRGGGAKPTRPTATKPTTHYTYSPLDRKPNRPSKHLKQVCVFCYIVLLTSTQKNPFM